MPISKKANSNATGLDSMKNWKRSLVKPYQSVREAIAVIDQAACRAAFVVDDHGHLRGMLTDGDIRRGLLNGATLSDPVDRVMNPNPVTCPLEAADADHVETLLDSLQLLHMPIVSQGKLVNVMVARALKSRPRYDNPVFLMAGGFGTRLRPLTENCPKPMLKVGTKPILEIILENFIACGFHRFYISTHFMPEVLRDHFGDGSRWGVSIQYIHETEPLGTAGALGLLPESVGELPLIMMNGDLLTKVNFEHLLHFHEEQQGIATVCLHTYEMQVPYGVMEIQERSLAKMVEKPTYRFFINAGIYVVNAELRRQIQAGQRIDMPTLLEKQVQDHQTVATFPIHEYWLDIGKMPDFERAQQDVHQFFH
jgi:dTDP-glucose pyrophosphorylase